MKLTHKKFLITSLPFTAASVSVPLIGAVDTAIAGGLGSYHYINSVALGSVIFSTIFWLFNFLGLTASGFASQSLGSGNKQEELCAIFARQHSCLRHRACYNTFAKPYFNAAVQFLTRLPKHCFLCAFILTLLFTPFLLPCFTKRRRAGWQALCRCVFPLPWGLRQTLPTPCWHLYWFTAAASALPVWLRLPLLQTSWRQFLRCTDFTKAGRVH